MSDAIKLEIRQTGRDPVSFDLVPGSYSIGRDAGAKIRLRDPGISEQHAVLTLESDRGWIEDRDSSNGTFVNDTVIKARTPITAADLIELGSFVLHLNFPQAQAAAPPAPEDAAAPPPAPYAYG